MVVSFSDVAKGESDCRSDPLTDSLGDGAMGFLPTGYDP